MEHQPTSTNNSPQTQNTIQPTKQNPQKRRIRQLAIVVICFILLLVGVFTTYETSPRQPQTVTVTKQDPSKTLPEPPKEPIAHTETITPTAFGNFLSLSLESYWSGGNINGEKLKAHYFYPSVADLKNTSWTKTNLMITEQINESLQKGTITYITEGCDAGKPSSEQNKCTAFTLRENDKTIATSRN